MIGKIIVNPALTITKYIEYIKEARKDINNMIQPHNFLSPLNFLILET